MSEPLKRALRTFVQALAGLATAAGVTAGAESFGATPSESQILVGVIVATACVAFAQNLLEDSGTIKDRR